jgi:hypothetical protein
VFPLLSSESAAPTLMHVDPDGWVVLVLRAWAEEGHIRVRVLASGAVRGTWVTASVPDAMNTVRALLDQLAVGEDAVVTPGETPSETRGETPE